MNIREIIIKALKFKIKKRSKLKEAIIKEANNLESIKKEDLSALIKKDKTGKWIYLAGMIWKNFNFEKGLDALIKIDKTGSWIYKAGENWKKFNYEKGLKALKKFPAYYEVELQDWSKNRKQNKLKEAIIKEAGALEPSKRGNLTLGDKRKKLKAIYKKILIDTPYAKFIPVFQKIIDDMPENYIEYELKINLGKAENMVDDLIRGKGEFAANELGNINNIVSGIGVPALTKYTKGKFPEKAQNFGAKAINKNVDEYLKSKKQREKVLKIETNANKQLIKTSPPGKEIQLVRKELVPIITNMYGKYFKGVSGIKSNFNERIAKSISSVMANSSNFNQAKKKLKKMQIEYNEDLLRQMWRASSNIKNKVEIKSRSK